MKRQQCRDGYATSKRPRYSLSVKDAEVKARGPEAEHQRSRVSLGFQITSKHGHGHSHGLGNSNGSTSVNANSNANANGREYTVIRSLRDAKMGRPKTNARSRNRRGPRDVEGFGLHKRKKNERPTSLNLLQISNNKTNNGARPRSRRWETTGQFRTLCVSNIRCRVSLEIVREVLHETFSKFSELDVHIVNDDGGTIAYVDFASSEDAQEAKQSLGALVLFDMPVRVECVAYNKNRKRTASLNAHSSAHDSYSNDDMSPLLISSSNRQLLRHTDDRILPAESRHHSRLTNDEPEWTNMKQDSHSETRFPHHLTHIKPEDDAQATRTLFVGNLDYDISEPELQSVFKCYGKLQDIDIKRPLRGTGNAYAFVKFINLDMAHDAKVHMSGEYIGKFQCKIGYGKVSPTNCVWICGLGSAISLKIIESEFDRFGVIRNIDWQGNSNHAYVLYENTVAAAAACQLMRGFQFGGSKQRLRVDFADESLMAGATNPSSSNCATPAKKVIETREPTFNDDDVKGGGRCSAGRESGRRGQRRSSAGRSKSTTRHRGEREKASRHVVSPASEGKRAAAAAGRSTAEPPAASDERHATARDESAAEGRLLPLANVDRATTVSELAKCLPVVWSGALVLKNSSFAARMHLLSGNVRVVDTLMRDQTTTEMPVLRITQRLRLDRTKLDEVGRRVASSGANGHSILLAMPGCVEALENSTSPPVLQRPLRNLVSYLSEKHAAGVIGLPPNRTDSAGDVGLLHAFPPCQFGYSLLSKSACKLEAETPPEHHLVVVVVKDGV